MQLYPRLARQLTRPVIATLAILALVVAELAYLGLGPATSASAAAPGQGSDFDCTGGTIYALQIGAGGGDATIYGLDTTSFGATVPATPITTVPGEASPNALGLTRGGAFAYTVTQTATSNSVTVYRYDAVNQSWKTYTGTATTGSNFIAGAVDPFTGIYYYANYGATGKATVYGFNTNTNTAIPGVIATITLPITSGSVNGDMAFDRGGNLYVIESRQIGTTAATGVVRGPLPMTGDNVSLAATTLQTYTLPVNQGWNGIAFDNYGQLFVEYTTGTTTSLQGLNPNTGGTISAAAPEGLTGTALAGDLAACSLNPTLTVQTNVVGRSSPSDEFTMSVTGGGITQGNTGTTTGSSDGVQAAEAGPVIGVSGTSYSISETAASGSLANYTSTYSCTDAEAGDRVVASGTGTSFNLPFPDPAVGATGAYVTCVFTLTPTPASLDTVKTLQKINGVNASSGDTLTTGDVAQYALAVTNTGGDSGTTSLSDPVPAHTTYTGTAGEGWSCTAPAVAGTACTQSVTVGPNAAVTKNYTVTVGALGGAASIANIATSSVGTCSACTVTTTTASSLDTVETLTSVNGDTSATTSTPVTTGDIVVYTDTTTNSGGTSDTVTLTQTVPANTTYTGTGEGWSCSGTTAGSTCTQTLTVGAGTSPSRPFTVTVAALPRNTTAVSDTVTANLGSCSACSVSNPTSAQLDTTKTIFSINGGAPGTNVNPGDTITYLVQTENYGGSTGSTSVGDTVPANTTYTGSGEGWSCDQDSAAGTPCTQVVAALGAGATANNYYTVTVANSLPPGNQAVTNTATSTAGTCSACTVTIDVAPSLDTVKAVSTVNGLPADSNTPVQAGDVIVYTDTTTNSGGSTGSTVLSDPVPANTSYTGAGEGWSCTAPAAPGTSCTQPVSVPAGTSVVKSYTVTVAQPLAAGTKNITATVASNNGTCSACAVSNPTVAVLDTVKTIVTVNGNPATSSTQLSPGDVVVYHDTVTNTGGTDADITLSDTVPANTTYTGPDTQGWSCTAPADAGTTCTQAVTVTSGGSVITDYTVTVNEPLPSGTQSITSTVTTDTGTCSDCSVSNPTVAVLDTVQEILSVNGQAATSSTQLEAGDVVIYRDTISNTGGTDATTLLTEQVPEHTTYTGAAGEGWSCTAPAVAGTACTQSANVPANTTVHRDYTVTVDQPLAAGTASINSSVTSGTGTCSACSVVNPTVPVLDTVKTIVTVNGNPADSTTELAPGDVVVYRDTVTNTGGSSASTLLTDTVPAATTFTGSAGQGWSCSAGAAAGTGCVQSVGVAANDSTSVDFTVTVANPIPTGTQTITSAVTSDTGTCSACSVTNATVAELDTTKVLVSVNGQPADANTQVKPGDVLVYSVTVTNTGGTAGSTIVTDKVPANTTYTGDPSEGWSCSAGDAAGTSCTQTFNVPANDSRSTTYTVTVGTLPPNTTTIANPVTTSNGSCSQCDGSNPTVGTLTSTLTLITDNGSPATSSTHVKAGDVLVYQITTHNDGGSSATTTLSNPVPVGTSYTGALAEGWSCASGAIAGTSCTQDVTLAGGGTSVVVYTVTVNQPLAANTLSIGDSATSSTGSCDCQVSNATVAVLDTSETILTVNGQPADETTQLKGGDVVVYGVTVSNTGGTSAATIVTNKVPADATYTGDASEGWSCTAPAAAQTPCTRSFTVLPDSQGSTTYTITVVQPIPADTTTIADPISTSVGTCSACNVSNPTVAQLATVKKLSKVNGDPVVPSTPAALHAGDVVTYAITVSNTGGSAGSTDLTETVPANTTYTGAGEGWTCAGTSAASQCTQSVNNLAKLSSQTVTFTVTVSNLPRGTQNIENTVLTSTGTCSCTVDTATFAALDTVKTLAQVNGAAATSATRLTAGDVAAYQITVANTGGSTGTTTLLETVPDNTTYTGAASEGWNCASGTCAQAVTVNPFSSATVNFTVTVDNPLAAGTQQITNTVASSVGTCSACTVTSPTVGVLDTVKVLALVNGKPASSKVRVKGGDTLAYAVAVSNSGGSAATTTLTETVPSHTLFLGKTQQGWSCVAPAAAGTQCTQNVQVQPGATQFLAFTVGVKGPLPASASDVVNVVTTTAGTCSACRVSTPLQHADVLVTKTADTDNASVGGLVHFTVRAHNNGPDAATDLVVIDTPRGMHVMSSQTAAGSFDEHTGRWHIGTLASGATVVLHTTDKITSTGASNAANAFNPTQVDPDPANGVASVTVHKNPSADLPQTSGTNGLAGTGTPTESLLRLASLLMLLGIGVLVLGRRRYRGRKRA